MSPNGQDIERLRAWAEILDDSSYYELLGVLDLADADAIKIAFHEFALAFHPDVHAQGSEEERNVARHVFRRGAEAYRVLSDPDLRPKYDLALARGHLRLVEAETSRKATGAGLKSLEDLCRSPGAKLSARRADEEIGEGKLVEARRLLQQALSEDGFENADLEERIEALDLAIFATGR